MRPFGIVDAIIGVIEFVGDAFRRRKMSPEERKRDDRSSNLLYWLSLIIGTAAMLWITWSMYFE